MHPVPGRKLLDRLRPVSSTGIQTAFRRGRALASGGRKMAQAMCLVFLAGCIQGGQGEPIRNLQALVVGCQDGAKGEPRAFVEFEIDEHGQSPLRELVRRSALFSYRFKPENAEDFLLVGGLPPAPGSIDLLPRTTEEATVGDDSPPTALVPRAFGRAAFKRLLFAVDAPEVFESPTLDGLIGRSADAPLGRVTITDVRADAEIVEVILDFEWNEILNASDASIPIGALVATLEVGVQDSIDVGPHVTLGTSGGQWLLFELNGLSDESARLTLNQWGHLYEGEVGTDLDICPSASP